MLLSDAGLIAHLSIDIEWPSILRNETNTFGHICCVIRYDWCSSYSNTIFTCGCLYVSCTYHIRYNSYSLLQAHSLQHSSPFSPDIFLTERFYLLKEQSLTRLIHKMVHQAVTQLGDLVLHSSLRSETQCDTRSYTPKMQRVTIFCPFTDQM